ncbi:DUF4307 domain-containing protein [Nocardioides aurantiacus]|uniref:DUF4307 domain-containing protein n=1 Tax=Nocardioides aurantiacus TaxID=86796 RepID=UPI001476E2EC|nr:DUF4307 domain-containing protein [Nocardioides aurantiacus]
MTSPSRPESGPGSSPTHDTGTDLAERYGRSDAARRRRLVVAVSGLVGVVALAWLGWVALDSSSPDVQSRLTAYDVVDGRTARATVTVTLADPDVRASCLVRAVAVDSSPVGERSFTVTGVEGPSRVVVDVRTEREADTVRLIGCTTPDQSRPR